jgi:hypothetical protein
MNPRRMNFLIAIAILTIVQTASAEVTGSFSRMLNVTATPEVEVYTGSGDITIRTGDGKTVAIQARIRASSRWFGSEAMKPEERVRRIEQDPPIKQSGNIITIGRIEDRELRRNVSISYEITVPENTKLQTETGSGDQSISGTVGPLRASTGSGGIHVANINGEARVETGSGDIRLEQVRGRLYAETGSGNIRAESVHGGVIAETGSGDIEYTQATPADVAARTGSGNVRLRNVVGGVEASTGSGDIDVSGEAKGNWEVSSGSGEISLNLPAQAAFEVNARTSSGSIDIAHPVTMQGRLRKNHVQGKVGAGGVLISASTGSGNINIQ